MLVFLADEMMLKSTHDRMKIPWQFVSYSYIADYRLIKINKKHCILANKPLKTNNKVFGALFEIDVDRYGLRLDAHYESGETLLHGSKKQSNHIKVLTNATPISFSNIYEFTTHRYEKQAEINCLVYILNPNAFHSKVWFNDIKHKVCKTGTDNNSLSQLLKCTLGAKGD